MPPASDDVVREASGGSPRKRGDGPDPAAGGFTLLEVLIAVAILAISLTSLISSQFASLRATDYARQISAVTFLAEAKLIDFEYDLKLEGGWGLDDKVVDGDFSEEGWPTINYICVADMIEMPDYQELLEAKNAADTDGFGGIGNTNIRDAGSVAFDTMGMVWPIVKEAIEQSIRKSWCTVRWSETGMRKKSKSKADSQLCGDWEDNCLTVMTFWTDASKLMSLPSAGGESGEDDDTRGDPGGQGGKDGGGRGGQGGGGAGGGSRNPAIPTGPGGGGEGRGGGGMGPKGGR